MKASLVGLSSIVCVSLLVMAAGCGGKASGDQSYQLLGHQEIGELYDTMTKKVDPKGNNSSFGIGGFVKVQPVEEGIDSHPLSQLLKKKPGWPFNQD